MQSSSNVEPVALSVQTLRKAAMTVRKCLKLTPQNVSRLAEPFPSILLDGCYENYDNDLRAISLEIHKYHELAYQEYRSAELLCEFLEKNGFLVERKVAGLETAFVATFEQGGGPIVSFNAVED